MTERLTRERGIESYRLAESADAGLTQRGYADLWGVSVSTANAWIREANGLPNKGRTRARTEPNTAPNTAEQATEQRRTECRTCTEQAEQIREILALVRVLASPNSLPVQEKNPPTLRSGGGPNSRTPNTEQAEHQPNTEQPNKPNTERRTRAEQRPLLDLEPPDRSTPPGPDSPLLNLLKGHPPTRLDGSRPASATEWLDETWPLLAAQVDAQLKGKDVPDTEWNALAKALMLRWWKNRKPRAAGATNTREIKGWQHG